VTQYASETTKATVRVAHSGRDGITLAVLRQFVREADELDLPGDVRIRWEDKLAGEGANRSGWVEASHATTRELPIVLPNREVRS